MSNLVGSAGRSSTNGHGDRSSGFDVATFRRFDRRRAGNSQTSTASAGRRTRWPALARPALARPALARRPAPARPALALTALAARDAVAAYPSPTVGAEAQERPSCRHHPTVAV